VRHHGDTSFDVVHYYRHEAEGVKI